MDIPFDDDIPVDVHGVPPNVDVGADGLTVKSSGGGLRPPAPSSVEPRGIPTRPTDIALIPVGDDADAAGPANALPPPATQVPDALPVVPPPSKIVLGLDTPVDIPVPTDDPDTELNGIPVMGLPGVIAVLTPNEACGTEPPMPEHSAMLPVAGPIGDAPDVVGLTPGDASSVAPSGMPTGATGKPGPMPRGDVMPSGEEPGVMPIPPTCAEAGPQLKRKAAAAAITKRPMDRPYFGIRRRRLADEPIPNVTTHAGITLRGLPRLCRCCVDRTCRRHEAYATLQFGSGIFPDWIG